MFFFLYLVIFLSLHYNYYDYGNHKDGPLTYFLISIDFKDLGGLKIFNILLRKSNIDNNANYQARRHLQSHGINEYLL